jgi:DNA-binding NarL/FixJ family response regulator
MVKDHVLDAFDAYCRKLLMANYPRVQLVVLTHEQDPDDVYKLVRIHIALCLPGKKFRDLIGYSDEYSLNQAYVPEVYLSMMLENLHPHIEWLTIPPS